MQWSHGMRILAEESVIIRSGHIGRESCGTEIPRADTAAKEEFTMYSAASEFMSTGEASQ